MASTTTMKRTSLSVLKIQEREAVGGFSETTKMPWLSWSISAHRCQTGSKLADVEGSTCSGCYALSGNYRYSNVQAALERRYSTLEDLTSWVERMVSALLERASRFIPTEDDPSGPAFRWHDSGDLQSPEHLAAICQVAERTQSAALADGTIGQIRHWLPTREYGFVQKFLKDGGTIPSNLCVRLSAHMINGPVPSRIGLPVSSVHTDESAYPDAAICPAYRQDGRCGSCRTCWDASVQHVSYPKH